MLEELARQACEREGAELWEIVRTSAGGRQVLRVVVDHPAGVTLPLLERVSRRISKALDEADPIQGSYVLECESPGPRRRLRSLEDCVRFLGSWAVVRLHGESGRRKVAGRLLGAADGVLHLGLEGDEQLDVAWSQVETAHLDQER